MGTEKRVPRRYMRRTILNAYLELRIEDRKRNMRLRRPKFAARGREFLKLDCEANDLADSTDNAISSLIV